MSEVYKITCEDAISFCVEAVWGFAEVSPDGKFVWVNPAYCQILNAPPDLIIGTTFQRWTHPDDLAIDEDLANKVKTGAVPAYTLAKRYLQRGSTPANPRVIWGMLSVSGKWSVTNEFLGFRVQFRPYENLPTLTSQIDIKKILEWCVKNWKTLTTVIIVSTSLILGGSDRLLTILQKAKDTKQSVDSVLSPSSSGASQVPHSP